MACTKKKLTFKIKHRTIMKEFIAFLVIQGNLVKESDSLPKPTSISGAKPDLIKEEGRI